MTKKMAQNREKRLAKLNVLKFILVLYSTPIRPYSILAATDLPAPILDG